MNSSNTEPRHRTTQASAGTGKTTWITQQVVHLLAQEKVRLDELLLMTYTERATGDLKARLRLALEKALDDQPEHRAPLQTALDSFDQAQVYTIHGFCNRVLLDHPFETGFDFRPVLVHDADLRRQCLRELQRIGWPPRYGAGLAGILQAIGYTSSGAEAWEKLVVDVAGAYRPQCEHVLRPELGRLRLQPHPRPGDGREKRRLLHRLNR